MISKYVRVLEERDINPKTNSVWSIDDVPNTWKTKVRDKVIMDGYSFNDDGTVIKNEENQNE